MDVPIKHQRKLAGRVVEIALKELEQLGTPLVLVDASDVDGKRPPDVVLLPEAAGLRTVGDVRSDADHDTGEVVIARGGLDHRSFFVRVVHHRPDTLKNRAEHRQADCRVALGGWHKNGARRRRADAVVRVVIAVAEEQAVVVLAAVPRDVVNQGGGGWTLGVEPVQLVAERVRLLEDAIGSTSEQSGIAFAFHAKPAHGDTVDGFDAGRQLVAPRHVVRRARREDLDLRVFGEMLGDVAGMELGAAVDRLPVSLNDDRDLHC